jgi:tetratricopeptide (TPR) repeat protein
LQEAIATAREAGNQRELAFGLLWQGLQEAWYGDRNTARRQIDEALGIAEGVGDAVLLGFAYVNLAALAIRGGDADGAERNLSALQQIAPSLGLRSLLQVWLLTIARESYAEALRLARRSGATNYRFRVLERWAAYCLASGDPRNSAVVLGCLGSFSNRAQIETFGFQELWVDPATAAGARQSLGEEAYAFSFAEGQRLTLEEMLECALASATPDSAPSP